MNPHVVICPPSAPSATSHLQPLPLFSQYMGISWISLLPGGKGAVIEKLANLPILTLVIPEVL